MLHAPLFVIDSIFELCLQFLFSVDVVGSGLLRKIISGVITPEPPIYCRKKRDGQLKTWMTTLKDDIARLSGPAVYGLRHWNRGWVMIGIA